MKVQEWKKQEVESLKNLILEYPVLGIVDSTNLPSMQLQKIRFKLKPDVLIKMTRSRLLKLAILTSFSCNSYIIRDLKTFLFINFDKNQKIC